MNVHWIDLVVVAAAVIGGVAAFSLILFLTMIYLLA